MSHIRHSNSPTANVQLDDSAPSTLVAAVLHVTANMLPRIDNLFPNGFRGQQVSFLVISSFEKPARVVAPLVSECNFPSIDLIPR